MKPFRVLQLDVFTDTPLAGNPCAVVADGMELRSGVRQAVAREMNLSETAFVERDGDDFVARYYTPAEEIPLAGHPTVAVAFALAELGWITAASHPSGFYLQLKDGPVRVALHWVSGVLEEATMYQRRPEFGRIYQAAEVAPVFGLQAADLLPDAPVQTVSTGTPQLMLPLTGHAALRRARPDVAAYLRLRAQGDFFSPHLFCLQGATGEGQTFARHFGTPPDLFEDPFTGSATGGMAAYLWRHDLIDAPNFVAEQGHWMGRPGQASVAVHGSREDMEAVAVGGTACLVMQGELRL